MFSDVSFSAMGCQSRVVVNGADHARLATWAIDRIEELESLWSRFRPRSEISALNHNPSQMTTVSPETFALVAHAIEAWELTGRRFDPTMLEQLIEHGYDRTHTELAPPGAVQAPPQAMAAGRGERSLVGDIVLVPAIPAVMLPAGTSLDPGGIGKGLGADIVATELMEQGASGVLVDLGGDLRVIGEHPDGGTAWPVVVNPMVPGIEGCQVGLADGGIATSSQLRRRWATGSGDRHHLLDPASGQPSSSPVAAVVVAGGAAWQAEAIAKGALLAGFDGGQRLIADNGTVGLLLSFDGTAHDAGLLDAAALV
jgi:thiamine biosynthesis lipoprotein